jgi:hypothetical protein
LPVYQNKDLKCLLCLPGLSLDLKPLGSFYGFYQDQDLKCSAGLPVLHLNPKPPAPYRGLGSFTRSIPVPAQKPFRLGIADPLFVKRLVVIPGPKPFHHSDRRGSSRSTLIRVTPSRFVIEGLHSLSESLLCILQTFGRSRGSVGDLRQASGMPTKVDQPPRRSRC